MGSSENRMKPYAKCAQKLSGLLNHSNRDEVFEGCPSVSPPATVAVGLFVVQQLERVAERAGEIVHGHSMRRATVFHRLAVWEDDRDEQSAGSDDAIHHFAEFGSSLWRDSAEARVVEN